MERPADRLSDAPATTEAVVRAAAVEYREGLAAAGVHDAVVAPGAEEALARRSRIGWMLLALSPLAVAGLLANAVPTALVYAVGRRPMPPVTHATAKFLTAIVAFAANWAALRWWVFGDTAQPWLLTLAAGPASGLAALWCVGRVIRARLGLRTLAGAAAVLEDLRALRAHLVHAVRAATSSREGGSGPDGAGSLDIHP